VYRVNNNWLQRLAIFYLFILPLVPRYIGLEVGDAPFLSVLRIATILLLLAWLLWSLFLTSEEAVGFRPGFSSPIYHARVLVLLYLFIMLVSVIFSHDITTSLKYFLSERVFVGVLAFFCFHSVFRRSNMIDIVLKVWLISAVIVLFIGLFDLLIGRSVFSLVELPGKREMMEGFLQVKQRAGFMRVQSTLDNPVTLSTYLLMTFPIVVYFFNKTPSVVGKVAYGVLLWLVMGVLLLTFVRSAWFFMFLSIVILLRSKYLYLVLSGFVVLMALVIGEGSGFGVSEKADTVTKSIVLQEERQVSKSTVYRIEMLVAGFETLKASPFTGVGPGNFGSEVEGDYFGERINFEHHENYYITALVETGILGFGAYLFMVSGVIRMIWKARKNEIYCKKKSLYTVILLSMSNYLGMGFFVDSFSYFQISFLFWLLVAIALIMVENNNRGVKYFKLSRNL